MTGEALPSDGRALNLPLPLSEPEKGAATDDRRGGKIASYGYVRGRWPVPAPASKSKYRRSPAPRFQSPAQPAPDPGLGQGSERCCRTNVPVPLSSTNQRASYGLPRWTPCLSAVEQFRLKRTCLFTEQKACLLDVTELKGDFLDESPFSFQSDRMLCNLKCSILNAMNQAVCRSRGTRRL
jgi:hypothetical protein